MTLEINTTRGIAAQILRHRSFTYQGFSQRYADTNLLTPQIPVPDLRSQDSKNRQNSIDDVEAEKKAFLKEGSTNTLSKVWIFIMSCCVKGLLRECARFVLPLATPTKIYMTGSMCVRGSITSL